MVGNSVVFSVVVTPATASTGIAVQGNLSSIGGSASQTFALSTTANTYTFSYAIPSAQMASAYQIPVSVTDQQGGSATGSISLTVQPQLAATPIATLQSQRSTYVGQTVMTRGIVTAVISNSFFIQTASASPGSTGFAEGLDVFTSSRPTVAVGDDVTVSGNLVLYVSDPSRSGLSPSLLSHMPAIEISSPAISVNSNRNALPAPVVLATGYPTPAGGIYQLQKYEGMRVTFPSMTAIGPTDGFTDEGTATATSSGEFYAAATGIPRPFREPGMDFREFPQSTCPTVSNCTATTTTFGAPRPANLVLYDDNPERVLFESSSAGGTALDLSPGAVLTNITGVVDFTYATDTPYGDPARIFLDPGTITSTNYTPSTLVVTALPVPSVNQFTVAAFNVERFFNNTAADNFYYNPATKNKIQITNASDLVVLTNDAYSRRLKKFSLAIRTVLNNPDIISVEEVENVKVLQDMAAQIDADTTTGTKPGYLAFGTDSVNTFTNDQGGISIGFLVKPARVSVTKWEQVGTESLVPTGTTLNDRPSQVLHATVSRGTGLPPYPVTVIANHLRSLNGIGSSDNTRVKKELQAEMLATLIQGYQANKEHVIAVGDMNAFQFSDGYTDTIGTITGRLSPAGTAVKPGVGGILTTPATDLINTLPAAAQQSYTEWGSAQVLDHAIVTDDLVASSQLQIAHIDSDFPVSLFGDASTPAALSDHEPLLVYTTVPALSNTATLAGTAAFPSTLVGASSAVQIFTLTNTGELPITISSVVTTGDFTLNNTCGATLAVGANCTMSVAFQPAAAGVRNGTLTVTSTATVTPVSLTGTGTVAVPDFALGDSGSGTSVSVIAGGMVAVPLKLTSANGFAGSITFSCAYTGGTLTGASCTVTSPVTLAAGGTATATVSLTTTSRTATAGLGVLPVNGRLAYLLLMATVAVAALLMRRVGRNARVGGLLALLFALAIGITGCSGGGKSTTPNANGTPAGTYTFAVTATANGTSHSQNITLTVQ
jgi:hypothetical protein